MKLFQVVPENFSGIDAKDFAQGKVNYSPSNA
jgi:hypothetical protein